jgi:hypothetical protein
MTLITLADVLAKLAELETAQMALPRGPHIWPNPPIEAIQQQAFELIESSPHLHECKGDLIDAFTWGLADEYD